MSSGAPRRLGWQPGSYRAVERAGHYRGGPNARGAFDGGYNNGFRPAPAKGPSQGESPRAAAEALFKPATAQDKPKAKPKHWNMPPFAPGDIIICGAKAGVYRPCEDCHGLHFEVKAGYGQIPARLRCQRCGRTNRELRKTHVA
jgi:hypothetical protein